MNNLNTPKEEYPFVIGTAGHIDHGKTTLVRALSGVDCDRLSEEKKRGMTIELGFAPFTLPSGKVVSIVDVPGHEKFIRQMVAGAAGIDAVMLVVAADDGVMPQTVEHLEILSLLGVKNGITVINKCDLVDEDTLELAKEDVRSVLTGTFLENSPVICVSAVKGTGLEELRSAMQKMVDETKQKTRIGKFFMPVDRIFKISGFGTVVTGTALTGTISEGDSVELLPENKIARVRSLQVHNNNVEKAFAGQRVAINIAGLSVEDIEKGDVFASENFFESTDCIDVSVKLLESVKSPVAHWQRVRLHIGTSDVLAHISLFDRDKLLPGETATAQLILDKKIAASSGSNFIIRNYSPLKTIAGGTVLFANSDRPRNKNSKKRHIEFLNNLPSRSNMREYIEAVVNYKRHVTGKELGLYIQADLSEFRGAVSSLEMKHKIASVKTSDVHFFSIEELNRLKTSIDLYLEKFHRDFPERIGAAFEDVASSVSVTDMKLFRELLLLFEKYGWYESQNGKLRMAGFEAFDIGDFVKEAESCIDYIDNKGYILPTIDELSEERNFSKDKTKKIISYLVEQGKLNIVAKCMLFTKNCQDKLYEVLRNIEGDIILSDVRDITGSSRKYILPMLEFFDSRGITRRVDDKRILMKKSK